MKLSGMRGFMAPIIPDSATLHPGYAGFCERLKANGKNGKAIACAAMRKLIHITFGIIKSGRPFDFKLALA